MPGFPVIHLACAPANQGVRASLEIQIRLVPEGLDEVDQRRKPSRHLFRRFSVFCHLYFLRPNSKQDQPPGEISRARELSMAANAARWCPPPIL